MKRRPRGISEACVGAGCESNCTELDELTCYILVWTCTDRFGRTVVEVHCYLFRFGGLDESQPSGSTIRMSTPRICSVFSIVEAFIVLIVSTAYITHTSPRPICGDTYEYVLVLVRGTRGGYLTYGQRLRQVWMDPSIGGEAGAKAERLGWLGRGDAAAAHGGVRAQVLATYRSLSGGSPGRDVFRNYLCSRERRGKWSWYTYA